MIATDDRDSWSASSLLAAEERRVVIDD